MIGSSRLGRLLRSERGWLLFLLGLGLVLRLALELPVHRYPADADALGVGTCVERILNGDFPVFYTGYRTGSIACFVAAGPVAALGPSRLALVVGPVISGLLLMIVWYLLVRDLFGARTAGLALPFIAVPPPAVSFWLYMPNSIAEIMVLCASILWLGVRIARHGPRWSSVGLYGIAIGVGVWSSMLTLGCTVPSLLWMALRCRRLFRLRWLSVLAVSAMIGSAPLLLFNLRYGFPTLTDNFASRPAASAAAVVDNVVYLLETNLPELVADLEPTHLSPSKEQRLAGIGALLLVIIAAWVFFTWKRELPAAEDGGGLGDDDGRLLGILVILFVCLFYVISAAGSVRGLQVRYILPLVLWIPPAIAFLLSWIAGRSRPVAVLIAAYLLVFNLAGLEWPGTRERRAMARDGKDYSSLVNLLEQQGVDLVLGDFWQVYSVNYLSGHRVKALPVQPADDYNRIAASLPDEVKRWAVMGWAEDALLDWVATAGATGTRYRVGRFALVVSRPERVECRPLVDRLRSAWRDAWASGKPFTS